MKIVIGTICCLFGIGMGLILEGISAAVQISELKRINSILHKKIKMLEMEIEGEKDEQRDT